MEVDKPQRKRRVSFGENEVFEFSDPQFTPPPSPPRSTSRDAYVPQFITPSSDSMSILRSGISHIEQNLHNLRRKFT